MNKPLVTILSPCYNVEEYLPQCIDSIINQTYNNLQIVLIDDGSNDSTWKIMQQYAQIDKRIEIYHQENRGVAFTRNKLLDKVKGDYVLFVDSDDWCELNMVEFLLDKAIKNNVEVSICSNIINNNIDQDFQEKILNKEETIKAFLFHKDLRGSLWNKLIKASLLNDLKFRNDISYGEDALFCWYLLQKIQKIYITTYQLYHYRMNESSISHSAFSPKKLSGHFVWEQICEETEKWYPQYTSIAQARHCIEDALLLRDAIRCNYANKNEIKILQHTIKRLRYSLNSVNITSFTMKIYILLLSSYCWISKIL